MVDREMLTKLDEALLAQAFPASLQSDAIVAARAVSQHLHERQWTERFALHVRQELVLIPARLHFMSESSDRVGSEETWLMTQALWTRSNDGFQRQRAARNLIASPKPWAAPFLLALIGEYVVEILTDMDTAMQPSLLNELSGCILVNPSYWRLVKQRVASYWNEYYRHSSTRSAYVGFQARGSA